MNPLVSVVISTHNRYHYLKLAVQSVLDQTYSPIEIIIIDNGSTDETRNIEKDFSGRVKYFYQNDQGAPAAKNVGIKKATGQYIAFLDDDDLWLPQKTQKQMSLLNEHPELGFICSGSFVMDKDGKQTGRWIKNEGEEETFESLYKQNFVLLLTVIAKKECLDSVAGFDVSLFSHDYDLWLRLSKRYPFKYMNEPLAHYRKYDQNMSNNINARLKSNLILLRKKEITEGISLLNQWQRMSKAFYYFAGLFKDRREYFMTSYCYFIAALYNPFIGLQYWPTESKHMKFSLPYRLLKFYSLPVIYLMKTFVPRKISHS
jgi:glycosyltransferase involved in cell wall biosynthesis